MNSKLWLLMSMLILVFVGCTPDDAPQVTPTPMQLPSTVDPFDTEMLAAQKTYDLYCAHCHGYSGGGQPIGGGPGSVEWSYDLGYRIVPRHDAEGHSWQHADQLLFEVIKKGVENPLNLYMMPSHGGRLSDDEIWGVIAYMKLFWTPEQREAQTKITENFTQMRPNWAEYNLDINMPEVTPEVTSESNP